MRSAMEKNIYLRRLAVVLGIFLTVTLTASAQRKLTILHVNDTHSHVEPFPEKPGQVGGVIERAAFIDSVRKADGKRNVLLLHAGDFSQGTSYFTLLKGDIEIDLMNALKYDVTAIGNHEFDNGVEDLARRLRSLKKTKVVCCNYDFSPFEVGEYVKPYVIVKKAGMKIGVIGLLTDVSSVVAKAVADRLPKLDDVAEVNRWADYLKNEKRCDLVIALTHIGYAGEPFSDRVMVPRTRNLDLVVGGHSHTFLKQMESATDLDGKEVPIVQDGRWGEYVGQITVIL